MEVESIICVDPRVAVKSADECEFGVIARVTVKISSWVLVPQCSRAQGSGCQRSWRSSNVDVLVWQIVRFELLGGTSRS